MSALASQALVEHDAAQIAGPVAVVPGERREMTPMEMVGRALEMGVSAEILKQMMDLRDREEARNAKMAFTKAVSAAKAELGPIMRTRAVDYTPSGKERVYYRHEDLAGIEKQVTPVLTRYGLSYRYESDNGPDRPITITCILEHVDGHFTRTPLSGPADNGAGKNSLQAIASTTTYLQRYTLKIALGLSVSHDDDGLKADEKLEDRITTEQRDTILKLIDETDTDVVKFCQWAKVDAVADMLAVHYDKAIAVLQQRKAKP
ncbi:ERF family protein [Mesorhizobium sp. Root172]|uniref:ERF family protein n=1 Tax=Mesorhizobium sp. Root172 TaxID=1736481 RepID=UPI0006FD8F13|nr:ERF family protein [Mesorhizobium sp. Root172]KRB26292.1 hypothetical protein ASE05_10310 [Mesorhizobium sp. Root172]